MEMAGTIVLPTGQAYEVLTTTGELTPAEWDTFSAALLNKKVAILTDGFRLRPVSQFLRTAAEKAEQAAVLEAMQKPAATGAWVMPWGGVVPPAAGGVSVVEGSP